MLGSCLSCLTCPFYSSATSFRSAKKEQFFHQKTKGSGRSGMRSCSSWGLQTFLHTAHENPGLEVRNCPEDTQTNGKVQVSMLQHHSLSSLAALLCDVACRGQLQTAKAWSRLHLFAILARLFDSLRRRPVLQLKDCRGSGWSGGLNSLSLKSANTFHICSHADSHTQNLEGHLLTKDTAMSRIPFCYAAKSLA